MAPGTARQASLEPLHWRLRLPRAALAVAEPTLVRSGVAPRALWGQVPRRSRRSGLSYRAARLAGSWPGVACCPAGLLVVGSGRRGMPPGLVAGKVSRYRVARARCPARIPEGARNSLARQRSPPGKPPRLGGRPSWSRWFGTVTTASRASLRPAFPGQAHRARRVAGTHTYALRARRCRRWVRHTWHASPVPPQCGCGCRSGGRSSRVRGEALGRVVGP